MIVQFGGQTPLEAGRAAGGGRRADRGHPSRGASTWPRTASGSARCSSNARAAQPPQYGTARPAWRRPAPIAARIGYPVLVRPVLRAGRPGDGDRLRRRRPARLHRTRGPDGRREHPGARRPLPRGRHRDRRRRAVATATTSYIGGVMEHIEEAGIHSGDSALRAAARHSLPQRRSRADRAHTRAAHRPRARRGSACFNVQYALQGRRALCTGSQSASQLWYGALRVQGHRGAAGEGLLPGSRAWVPPSPNCVPRASWLPEGDGATRSSNAPIAVKEAVLPFHRFRKADGSGKWIRCSGRR